MSAPAPPPRPGNGNGLSFSNPLIGSLAISGRDLMLAVVLLALGAAAVAVQVLVLRGFRDSFQQHMTTVTDSFQVGRRDRDLILAILRARSCAEALAGSEREVAPARPSVSDELRSRPQR